MNPVLRVTFSISILCALFAIAGLVSLYIYFILQLTADAASLSSLSSAIAQAKDLQVVKRVCVSVVDNFSKTDDASRILVWWGLGFMVLSSTVCGLMSGYAYTVARRFQTKLNNQVAEISAKPASSGLVKFFQDAQTGKLKLWKAFWLIYLPGLTIVPVAFFGLYAGIKKLGWIKSGVFPDFFITPLLVSTGWLWTIGLAVVVWRCSANTSHHVFTYISRLVVALALALPLIKIGVFIIQFGARI